MADDQTEGGLLDGVEGAAVGALLFPLGPIEDVWDAITGQGQAGDSTPQGAIASAAQGVQATADAILPSQTEVWAYIIAAIVILLIVAFISREVAG